MASVIFSCRQNWLNYGRNVYSVLKCQNNSTLFPISRVLYSTETNKNLEKLADEIKEPAFHFRERFIPLTRRSVIRHLMQEKDFLTEGERKNFEKFALAIDSAIVNKYHGILTELKMLFDPLNPDKDTIQTRNFNPRERIDNEFWLLQKMSYIMEKANFHELPKPFVKKALAEHNSERGLRVSADPNKYEVLRFWALGKETPVAKLAWYKKLYYNITKKEMPIPLEFYKRVVVAVRPRKDSKLMMKMFKDVPVNNLLNLLPEGKIRMTKFDRGILTATLSVGIAGILLKVLTNFAHYNIQWTLLVAAAAGVVATRHWTVFKNRRNLYLLDLHRVLYYKNIANNRGLLTLLVDRAEDESFKEALLAYAFLLTQRSPSSILDGGENLPVEIGGAPADHLEKLVEDWIENKVGVHIEYDSNEAVQILKTFGILSTSEEKLFVLPLLTALGHLPLQPESIILREEDDVDDIEGYDRTKRQATVKELKAEEKRERRFGWL